MNNNVPNSNNGGGGFFLVSLLLSLLFIAGIVFIRKYMKTQTDIDTRSALQITDQANKDIQQTKKQYGINDDTIARPPTSGPASPNRSASAPALTTEDKLKNAGNLALKVIKDTVKDPKFYEAVVLSKLLKTVLFKAEQKGALKGGEKAAAAIAKALEKVGMEAGAKVAEKVGVRLGEMAAGIEAGPPGWLFDVLSIGIDLWDPAGFNQFGSNKDLILDVRNKTEVAAINAFKEYNKNPPFIFSLSNTSHCQPMSPIATAFNDAVSSYQNGLMGNAIDQLPDTYSDKLLDDVNKGIDVSDDHELIDAIVNKSIELMNSKPKDRDAFIYQYITSKIPSNLRKYVEYNQGLSSKDVIAVSLSKTGCDEFNEKTLNDDNVSYMAIYSKNYRVLGSGDTVLTKQLSEPIAQQSFLKPVMNMCTGTSLTSKMELIDKMPRATVNPSRYGVTFNNDTGVCNYTKSYCERFGLKYKSSVKSGDITFSDCTELPGEELASLIFGTTLTHGAVFLGEKSIDGVEAGYDATRKEAVKTWKDTKGFFSKTGSEIVGGLTVAGGAIGGAATDSVDWIGGAAGTTGKWLKGAVGSIGSIFHISDVRVKTNIHPVEGKIYGRYQLPLYTWDWRADNPFGLSGKHMGVISHEVRKVCPEAVRVYRGYDVVNYNMLI